MTSGISYSLENGLATISIDDGKVNVMTTDLLGALCQAVAQARDDGAMILLRSGREKVFSAGFDVKPLASRDEQASRSLLQAGVDAILALLEHPFPVIGLCQGHAYPMGAFLLLASDVRIGVAGEYKIGMNEVAIGIAVPDFALRLAEYRLASHWIHRAVALGQMLSPQQAMEAGFLDELVPPEDADAVVRQVTTQLAGLDMAAHASTKLRLRAEVIEGIREASRNRLLPSR